MKLKTLLFCSILFCACSKTDKSILEQAEFKDLIGTWTTDYPNDEIRKVIVYKNGKVEVAKSTERGKKFQITSFTFNDSKLIKGADTLMKRSLSAYKNGKSHGYIVFFKKPFNDTAYINFIGFYIKGFEIDTSLTSITDIVYVKN